MGLLRQLGWTLAEDPYRVGLSAYRDRFFWTNWYTGLSDSGYRVRYRISCVVHKVNMDEFADALMLKESNQENLLDSWHADVFLRAFKAAGYSFKFLLGPNWAHAQPCYVSKEGENESVCIDPRCIQLCDEAKKTSFRKDGCIVVDCFFELKMDDETIKENYDMIKMRGVTDAQNTEVYRNWEEAIVVGIMHRKLELQNEFQKLQTDQKHKSSKIAVETKRVGNTVELEWGITSNNPNTEYVLHGFRRDDSFAKHGASFGEHGMCIAETSGDGRAVQHLQEGREYFYTFILTTETPVYRHQTFGDQVATFFGNAPLVRIDTTVVDSLRFSIRVPTQTEMLHVERTLEPVKDAPDPKREKINRAFEELTSFVEFEESLSTWERDLIKKVESAGYSRVEKKRKLERVESIIEDIRTRYT